MGFEIKLPLEFVVAGVPLSLAAKRPASRAVWRTRVQHAARAAAGPGQWATSEPVEVTILYLPATSMRGDLDNIVKPILDALVGPVYVDDSQVERIVVEKYEPGRLPRFQSPTPVLIEALLMSGPRVYVRIDGRP